MPQKGRAVLAIGTEARGGTRGLGLRCGVRCVVRVPRPPAVPPAGVPGRQVRSAARGSADQRAAAERLLFENETER